MAMSSINSAIQFLKDFTKDELYIIFNLIMEKVGSGNTRSEMYDCPYCSGKKVIRYGMKRGKQRFFCKDCMRTYITTTNTVMSMSHQSKEIWAAMIEDTLNGNTLKYSEKRLGISHQVAFNMRHKILMELETMESSKPTVLQDVSELDETYVLECYKGKHLPSFVNRPARKHGAVAQERGISNEYICICTGAQRKSDVVIKAVNRSKPTIEELVKVYTDHIANGTLLLVDGLKSYHILATLADCSIKNVKREKTSFYNLNTVNNLHSFIKQKYRRYRGVATKYINRYCALFKYMYRKTDESVQAIKDALLMPGASVCYSISDVKKYGLTNI